MSTQPAANQPDGVPLGLDGTPLTGPRAIACPDCRAPKFSACKRTAPGRKIQVQYLKGFHAARRAEFSRLLTAATQSTENGTPA